VWVGDGCHGRVDQTHLPFCPTEPSSCECLPALHHHGTLFKHHIWIRLRSTRIIDEQSLNKCLHTVTCLITSNVNAWHT